METLEIIRKLGFKHLKEVFAVSLVQCLIGRLFVSKRFNKN